MDILSMLGGGLTSLFSGGISTLFNDINQDISNSHSKDLMTFQNNQNIANWNMQNKYNTPKELANRLREAGFNPSLVLGQSGSVSPAGALASPSAQSQHATFNPDLMSNYIQLANLNADLRKKNAEADKAEAEAGKTQAEIKYQNIINSWANESEKSRIDNLRSATELARQNKELTIVEQHQIEEALPYIAKLKQAELDKLLKDVDLIDEEINTEVAKQSNLEKSDIALLASAYASRMSGDLSSAKTEQTEFENRLIEANEVKTRNEAREAYFRASSVLEDVREKVWNNNLRYFGLDTHSSPIVNAVTILRRFTQNITTKVTDTLKPIKK